LQARASTPGREGRTRDGADDPRRIVAAVLSAIFPGLGQALNRDGRGFAAFALPVATLLLIGLPIALAYQTRLVASILKPDAVLALLFLDALFFGWRLIAIAHAFLAGGRARIGGAGAVGLLLVVGLATAPQAYAGFLGLRVYETALRVCPTCAGMADASGSAPARRLLFVGDDPGTTTGPTPAPDGRINVLLMGVDNRTSEQGGRTDTLIVVSVDPVGRTASLLSIPRDLVDVPLPGGGIYRGKINGLLLHVNTHPDDPAFAGAGGSGTRALQDAVGELLGIEIHYYAKVDLSGFVKVIDAVGGVDVEVQRPLDDPKYREFGIDGFHVEAGLQHFDGQHALAYARVRRPVGETDFTRAARQQEVLVAIKDAVLEGGALELLGELPGLLDAIGDAVRTDLPPSRYNDLAFLAEGIDGTDVVNVVMKFPLVHPSQGGDPRGSIQIPDVPAIRAMTATLFSSPGTPPTPWPTPRPTP
jgi:LCP family protein required for cell wall assembly